MQVAFVIGCARSGTSILGELIGAHPDVFYWHEAHEVWKHAGSGAHDSHRLTVEHATEPVARKIRARFQRKAGTHTWVVEKCPRNVLRVPFLREVFPDAKLVHVVRDGRDVACSLMPGIGGTEWRHLKPENWQQLLNHDQGVIRCAKAWRAILETALDDLAGTPHITVRYEDLLSRPEATASELLQFLGLAPRPQVLEFCRNIQNSTAGSYQPAEQRKWFRDDHSVRVGRWKENLSDDEASEVESILRPMLDRLGYHDTLQTCQAP